MGAGRRPPPVVSTDHDTGGTPGHGTNQDALPEAMPWRASSARTVSLGCAPTLSQCFARSAPMGMLVSAVAALSTFYPEAKQIGDEAVRNKQIVRLIAKMPTLAAGAPPWTTTRPASPLAPLSQLPPDGTCVLANHNGRNVSAARRLPLLWHHHGETVNDP